MTHDVRRAVAEWFETHYAVITRQQAVMLGLTPAQIKALIGSGAWIRVHPGVYRLAGAPDGGLNRLYAGTLIGGARSLASHRSAAWLHGMRDRAPAKLTITVPHTKCVSPPGIEVVRSRRPPAAIQCRGIPCTAPIQTIMDCAALAGLEELDDLVDQALARKIVTVSALERGFGAPLFRHHPGRQAYAQRLAARGVTDSPHPSVLESRAARLIQSRGLPVPKAEVKWGRDQRYRLDFAYPHLRLVIEVDGWASHMSPEKQRYDNTRSNALNLAGWTVLHYDWWQITFDSERVAAEIRQAYQRLAAA